MECATGGIRLMSLKVITSLLVLLLVLAACRLTDELEVQPSATPPPTRDKGRAACDENPADWCADCGSQQYIHSTPAHDFTSVPDLSDS